MLCSHSKTFTFAKYNVLLNGRTGTLQVSQSVEGVFVFLCDVLQYISYVRAFSSFGYQWFFQGIQFCLA